MGQDAEMAGQHSLLYTVEDSPVDVTRSVELPSDEIGQLLHKLQQEWKPSRTFDELV